jgi:septal ring factor EnvC (AmiA/AmiB activator)
MDLPDIGRYRRRFIVEFGPEDSGLIDRMGVAHRTKRAAIIAGLRLLDSGELERLQKRLAVLEHELAASTDKVAAAQHTAASDTPKLDKTKADLATERAAHRHTQKALERATTTLAEARREVRRSGQEIARLQAERERLVDLQPERAFCPECEKLVPAEEWAEQTTATAIDVYHNKHRYRAKGALWSGTTPMFQRRLSGNLR